jgi:hypothetical protein
VREGRETENRKQNRIPESEAAELETIADDGYRPQDDAV